MKKIQSVLYFPIFKQGGFMKQKYEYEVVQEKLPNQIEDHINKKAKEGWEAVNLAVTVDTDFDEVYTTLMKREKK